MSADPRSVEPQRLTWGVRLAVALVRAYQGAASGRISPCRFYPSCSNYAVEAFTVHGFWRGLSLSSRRLVRCRPFGSHGVDLVPLRVHAHAHTHPTPRRHAGEDGRP
jgi:putative membrane protein insertion efficiency factor